MKAFLRAATAAWSGLQPIRKSSLNSCRSTAVNRFSMRALFKLLLIAFAFVITVQGATTITKTNYHGWPNTFIISNGSVEAIVVPSIGRVMQFKFVGEDSGPFWEN